MSFSAILRTPILTLGFIGALSVATTAAAQQPAAQASADMIKQQTDAMLPMITQMTRATLQISLDFYAQPATARALATFSKNYLDALVAVGFTREEALRIVTAHGLPTLPGVGR